MHRITRISYNSTGWQRPRGEASKLEVKDSFNSLHRFGFEDWFLRSEWEIDGWRYTFLQGANLKSRKYIGTPMKVSLYCIQPDKRRRWVAEADHLERLDVAQSEAAQDVFRQRGWLGQMEEEVRAVGGDPRIILQTPYAGHFLNVRYQLRHLHVLPADTFLPEEVWPAANYYKMYEPTDGQRRWLATNR